MLQRGSYILSMDEKMIDFLKVYRIESIVADRRGFEYIVFWSPKGDRMISSPDKFGEVTEENARQNGWTPDQVSERTKKHFTKELPSFREL